MRRKVATFLGTASVLAALGAAPASAADVGGGCVGSAVSSTAHFMQQDLGEGLGAYFHSVGEQPSQSIKATSQAFCTNLPVAYSGD